MVGDSILRTVLYDPRIRRLDVNSSDLIAVHRDILQEKPLLRSAFDTFYREMIEANEKHLTASGFELELGSGVGFLKQLRPKVITSDVRDIPSVDRRIDALAIDLPDDSVRVIYAINVFHHLADPRRFFSELCRVLKPGGGCVLVEPHNGLASSFLHRHLHKDEQFEPDAAAWTNSESRGPMSGANQALSYVVFDRDRGQFEEEYGDKLEIAYRGYSLNALRYFFSGGLNFRQMLPSFADPVLRFLERAAKPLARHWSLHQIIVLRKQ